jgi:hypothetical protein
MYISVFDDTKTIQGKSQVDLINENLTIKNQDASRLDDSVYLTTDESLLEISTIKNKINTQILKAVKETAMDCQLYKKAHKGENLNCYDGYGKVKTNNFGTHPTIEEDKGDIQEKNVAVEKVAFKVITISGVKHLLDTETNEIFVKKDAKKRNDMENLKLVGILTKDEKGRKVVQMVVEDEGAV